MNIKNLFLLPILATIYTTQTFTPQNATTTAIATTDTANIGQTKLQYLASSKNSLDEVQIAQYTLTTTEQTQSPGHIYVWHEITTLYKITNRAITTEISLNLDGYINIDIETQLGETNKYYAIGLVRQAEITTAEKNDFEKAITDIKKGIVNINNFNIIKSLAYDSLPESTTYYQDEAILNGEQENTISEEYNNIDTINGLYTRYIATYLAIRTTIRDPHQHDIQIWVYGDNTSILELKLQIPQQDIEVIDLPGTMWQVLGMPFTFISQAFNLTFFAGTSYAVNVAEIIFAVVGGLIIVLAIRLLLSK